ncbi:hypothetical protein [Polaribacter butkevichii]|uniref:Uncharacterized protein n=1 Tax=Polaribacter butkevichii TaxID=218490 RepID=A0A2P6C8K6_9FLAO|nr:hypothetical protein [Polaribacter butkevichii]PQJ69253.1 hypothetical protein BTO14_14620 [Polaribacter butkevichii]
MKIKIFLYGQEYNEKPPTPSGIKTRIGNLTNKHIYALNKLEIEAEVTIKFSSEDGRKATKEEMEFLVEAENKADKDEIWNTIIKTENNITE